MAKGKKIESGAARNIKSEKWVPVLDAEAARLIDIAEAHGSAGAQALCRLAEKVRKAVFSRLSLDYASAVIGAMEGRALLEKARREFIKKMPSFLGFYDYRSEKGDSYCYDRNTSAVCWNVKEKKFSFTGNKASWKKAQGRLPTENIINLKIFFPKKEKEELSFEALVKLVYGHSKRDDLALLLWQDNGLIEGLSERAKGALEKKAKDARKRENAACEAAQAARKLAQEQTLRMQEMKTDKDRKTQKAAQAAIEAVA